MTDEQLDRLEKLIKHDLATLLIRFEIAVEKLVEQRKES